MKCARTTERRNRRHLKATREPAQANLVPDLSVSNQTTVQHCNTGNTTLQQHVENHNTCQEGPVAVQASVSSEPSETKDQQKPKDSPSKNKVTKSGRVCKTPAKLKDYHVKYHVKK